MKLDKAIEILTKWREEESVDNEVELHEAERLGIEAMKAIKGYRWNEDTEPLCELPGEN